MISLRPYQQEALDAVFTYWQSNGGNPLVELATGLGKSVIIAKLTSDILKAYPDMRILMLVHVAELVEQNFKALLRLWPNAPAGIYSAGLGRRDAHHQITFASIQSVYKKANTLGPRDLVIIDEAHLVPKAGQGMYRTLLDGLRRQRPDMRVAGFTATAFRMDCGRLDQGDDRLFDETVYEYGIAKGIENKFLSPLISKASATEIDVSGVAKRGGEFIAGALEAAADRDELTTAAVTEITKFGENRRSWLVFCAGVKHAHHVRDAMLQRGISCAAITGEMPKGERARLIAAFKSGELRCLTNAQVLTTGFDAPATDLIAFLRPTLSTGLYVQMCGRGTRLAEGKDDCLVLDFAGNVRRHGPVDAIAPRNRKKRGEEGEEFAAKIDSIRAKECPKCQSLAALNARLCKVCGHEWKAEASPKHTGEADTVPILSTERNDPETMPVIRWEARRHNKLGSPDSLKIIYWAGLQTFPEWVALEHSGYAREKAERWWARHGGSYPVPATIDEALQRFDELKAPSTISVRRNGKWFDIVARAFPQMAGVA